MAKCKCGRWDYGYEDYPRPTCWKCGALLCKKCYNYKTDGKGEYFENCTYWCNDHSAPTE